MVKKNQIVRILVLFISGVGTVLSVEAYQRRIGQYQSYGIISETNKYFVVDTTDLSQYGDGVEYVCDSDTKINCKIYSLYAPDKEKKILKSTIGAYFTESGKFSWTY
ncbi:hypothetical protein GA0116948_11038 [Chitinophaga costaii]|uniref:Uncharacterized protein n=1 Tax=Chitinophaga costaii TaxID=1335309 RepID=A0A1C4EVQ0_9BACT|nr:hypothetical protein [Chitinophaga costaii]PUZ21621.1 hypothetical protein DCM91_16440 [Chitinophaga costaii]SCC47640.1 hypothetical protein GA0116948_11038 [Chitinophaga costaii]